MYSSGISVLKYQHFIITTDNLIQERSHLFPPPAFTFQTAVSGTKRSLTECSAQRDLMSADKPPHSPPPHHHTCWLKRELSSSKQFRECASHFMLQESVDEKKTNKKSATHFFLPLTRERRFYIPFRIWGPSVRSKLKDRKDFLESFPESGSEQSFGHPSK